MYNSINKKYYENLLRMGWKVETIIKNENIGNFPLSEKQCELLYALAKEIGE